MSYAQDGLMKANEALKAIEASQKFTLPQDDRMIAIDAAQKFTLAQDAWMTSIEAAQRFALAQDKMILMVWDQATYYPLPVLIKNSSGKKVLINNLFQSPEVIDFLWQHFVLLKIDDDSYPALYEDIKNRSFTYKGKFDDDSLKVMDANGNILNTSLNTEYVLDLTVLINKYALNTSYLKQELLNYRKERTFYTTLYLASRYVEFGFYTHSSIRPEIVDLSSIYINEARVLMTRDSLDNKAALEQRLELLDIEQSLVLNKPKKVIRRLKRFKEEELQGANKPFLAFMYFTAYRLLRDEKNAAVWRSKISSVDFDKAMFIIKNN